MGAFQPTHLVILLAIVMLLFGGAKIPELMKGIGKGVGELKRGLEEGKEKPSPSAEPASFPVNGSSS